MTLSLFGIFTARNSYYLDLLHKRDTKTNIRSSKIARAKAAMIKLSLKPKEV